MLGRGLLGRGLLGQRLNRQRLNWQNLLWRSWIVQGLIGQRVMGQCLKLDSLCCDAKARWCGLGLAYGGGLVFWRIDRLRRDGGSGRLRLIDFYLCQANACYKLGSLVSLADDL